MYLKSIEVHGFKSFANKIVFQFHNGITGIVGPNGSGKSNVADAVRWVLGEQRIKQLRGGSMQDVIFAGTEMRKALGSAYVAITLDNSDHQLPISYDEVTVARRLYRSGESEYLINGSACRLKDVNELFYDTGIGKEGYSIIGQGQIDKILSGKPEERRELFDEAAGIVKFKRRKQTAQKKLEDERQNLVRVNDILSELGRQIGPLEKQAETAKIYLKKREELKDYDINMFLNELSGIKENQAKVEENLTIAQDDLQQVKQAYEKTREEYDILERELEKISSEIEDKQEQITQNRLTRQQLENQIALLREQINTAKQSDLHYQERIRTIKKEISERVQDDEDAALELTSLEEHKQELDDRSREAEISYYDLQEQIRECAESIEDAKTEMMRLLNDRAQIRARQQRSDTISEQLGIRKAQLNQQVLRLKSEEENQNDELEALQKENDKISLYIQALNEKSTLASEKLSRAQELLTEYNQRFETLQVEYHREASRLESLKNITERYDGYGNSIRRVMEQKDRESGIHGVVADLIRTQKKFETAVETALGGNIQNIVTEDEETAKRLIQFLKQNKYGRATFLPLTAMGGRKGFSQREALKETGVIGLASDVVSCDEKYKAMVENLLGRTIVTDQIDHATLLARKYHYSLRIVTLEGELLAPGGSMTGGAFKNSGNLLGRRREIEQLEGEVKKKRNDLDELKNAIDTQRTQRNQLRDEIVALRGELQEQYLQQNTAQMKLQEMQSRKNETLSSYQQLRDENRDIEAKKEELLSGDEQIQKDMELSEERERQLEEENLRQQAALEQLRAEEKEGAALLEQLHLEQSALEQKMTFDRQTRDRISQELRSLREEEASLTQNIEETSRQARQKTENISEIGKTIQAAEQQEGQLREEADVLARTKMEKNASQKEFFHKREELSEQRARLDKECFRLTNQKEKLEETLENRTSYMWEEYELTYGMALKFKRDDLGSPAQIKKRIAVLKGEIRDLGNVNVNAIEDYKEVSERYHFLSNQHDDLVKAEAALLKIIEELDEGMRRQFREQFVRIQEEFDRAFKQLFGGGKGTLELVEDEDILEAGVRIIAQPPGKKLQNMMQLSGGEKSLTAIALLFAIQNLKPSPFCLLDEIEAALDESNVERYAGYLQKLTKHTQFIIITHRRGTMAAADRLYGITMQEKGVSALVSVNLIEEELDS